MCHVAFVTTQCSQINICTLVLRVQFWIYNYHIWSRVCVGGLYWPLVTVLSVPAWIECCVWSRNTLVTKAISDSSRLWHFSIESHLPKLPAGLVIRIKLHIWSPCICYHLLYVVLVYMLLLCICYHFVYGMWAVCIVLKIMNYNVCYVCC